MAQPRVTVEIDEETRRRLRLLAANEGMTLKELLRRLVEAAWQESPLAKRAGER